MQSESWIFFNQSFFALAVGVSVAGHDLVVSIEVPKSLIGRIIKMKLLFQNFLYIFCECSV